MVARKRRTRDINLNSFSILPYAAFYPHRIRHVSRSMRPKSHQPLTCPAVKQ